ncbi:class I SAM-dependent methyltransferase [Methylobacterium hispanicum]|uniref:class I SAM-dependent methyltransferase n=1 Tax=Methylobacterium hispanicum TaxID=270350 RepID=UPI002F2E426F
MADYIMITEEAIESNELVRNQYERFIYPEPIPDLVHYIKNGGYQIGDPNLYAAYLWPEGRPPGPLSILVAGCGANQAAHIALTNPDSRVIGLDLSEASLRHEDHLKHKHGLSNLELHQCDIRDVKKFEREYDLIISTGVLHHMPKPEEGLVALKETLSSTGKMFLMLYATGRRVGVYLMQEAFRHLGLGQSEDDVQIARGILNSLPPHHYAHWYMKNNVDASYDAGIVDSFLHPCDRSFSVPQLLDFVRGQGVAFQGWLDRGQYAPEIYYEKAPELLAILSARSIEDQWAFMDNILVSNPLHAFIVCRTEHLAKTNVELSDPEWLSYYPVRHPFLGNSVGTDSIAGGGLVSFQRLGFKFDLKQAEAFVIMLADGTRSVRDICGTPQFAQLPVEDVERFVRGFLNRMIVRGHLAITRMPCLQPQRSPPLVGDAPRHAR